MKQPSNSALNKLERLGFAREMPLVAAALVALAAPVGLGLLFALHTSWAIATCDKYSGTVLRSGHDQAKQGPRRQKSGCRPRTSPCTDPLRI